MILMHLNLMNDAWREGGDIYSTLLRFDKK